MPRHLTRPGHAFDQIIELCEAKLLQIHMSDVALREWRSQMTKDFLDAIKEMHSHLRHAIRQPLSQKLASRKLISQLLDKQDATTAEATREANKSCDEFIKRVGINEMPIGDSDGSTVFNGYFAGEAPFREPKRREDLPDAFILCAARRFAVEQLHRTRLAICNDRRLRGAIGEIPDVQPFEDLMTFLQSDSVKEAMGHLELSRLWTDEKQNEAIAILSKQEKFLTKLVRDFAYDTLQGLAFGPTFRTASNTSLPCRAAATSILRARASVPSRTTWRPKRSKTYSATSLAAWLFPSARTAGADHSIEPRITAAINRAITCFLFMCHLHRTSLRPAWRHRLAQAGRWTPG